MNPPNSPLSAHGSRPSRRCPGFSIVLAGLCTLVLGSAASAADAPGSGAAGRGREIRSNSPKPNAWHYARVGGLEILTTASDSTTTGFIQDFVEKSHALDHFWPVDRTGQLSGVLLLCARQEEYAVANPRGGGRSSGSMSAGGGRGGGGPRAAINLGLQNEIVGGARANANASANRPSAAGTANSAPVVMPNTNVGLASSERIIGTLSTEVLKQERSGAKAPSWLVESTGKLVAQMDATRTSVSFPALATDKTLAVRKAGAEADLEKALADGSFFPLERLFNGKNLASSETAVNECYEFVHLCLFGAGGKYRTAFLGFAAELQTGKTLDEAAFREKFGVDYRGMLLELWKYNALAKKTTFKLETPDGKPVAPAAKLTYRDATDEEIGRMIDPNSAKAPGF